MRGRKPIPTLLKFSRGNPGKRRLNEDEPQPGELSPKVPEEISDPVAREEWVRMIAPAIAIGHITASDRTMAIAHCELFATWRSQLADAVKHPHVVAVGANKYPTPNPARVMANKTLLMLAKVDAELGFTPSSRSRVAAAKKTSTNKKKERFFGTGGR